jgi:hypothetical protein
MAEPWKPPTRLARLTLFAVSVLAVTACLLVFLFAVPLEAVAPASGTISSRFLTELRSPAAGLVEPGWYEGELPGQSPPKPKAAFHRLEPGDVVPPGQVIAWVRPESWWLEEEPPERRIPVSVPAGHEAWLVVEVRAAAQQGVALGEPVATVVPVDPETRRPLGLIAQLEVEERHVGEVQPGASVRVSSGVYKQRLHGTVTGRVEKVAPCGQVGSAGQRCFLAQVALDGCSLPLPLGSSCKGDVVLGKKLIYRMILEH